MCACVYNMLVNVCLYVMRTYTARGGTQILLMSQGRVVYFGAVSQLEAYLTGSDLGYTPPLVGGFVFAGAHMVAYAILTPPSVTLLSVSL